MESRLEESQVSWKSTPYTLPVRSGAIFMFRLLNMSADAESGVPVSCWLPPGSPLAESAIEVGFSDQSHFTNAFRRETAMTPAAYLRLHSA
jgi:AraC-like DNA-binding protein